MYISGTNMYILSVDLYILGANIPLRYQYELLRYKSVPFEKVQPQ